jgi:multicomponent Na+:H+ antiporter subunit G
MDPLLELVGIAFFLVGGFLCLTGGVGLLRLPDFFCRVHAAGVTETLAAPMLLVGIMLHQGELNQDTFKLMLITLFMLATSPTASHAMAKAALHGGLRPLLNDGDQSKPEGSGGESSKR